MAGMFKERIISITSYVSANNCDITNKIRSAAVKVT